MAANRNGHRIEVVLFDAMYCLFEARGSRAKQLARIFYEEAGIVEKPGMIWAVTQDIRHSLPPSSDYKRDWVYFNQRIIARLKKCVPEDVSEELAQRIQRRILWDHTLYEVRRDILALIGWLSGRDIRLGIASNQDRAALDSMLQIFNIAQFFAEACIFTSDRIAGPGEAVSKPHERFWQLVNEQLDIAPEKVPFVGNSLRNDAPATRFGHPVFLFDRCGHQRPLLPADTTSPLVLCRSPKEIKEGLIQLGLP